MLKWVRNSFKQLFSWILWLLVVGCPIGGFIFGMVSDGIGPAVALAFAGLFVGTITAVMWGGLIATFLDMSEDLKAVRKKLEV